MQVSWQISKQNLTHRHIMNNQHNLYIELLMLLIILITENSLQLLFLFS